MKVSELIELLSKENPESQVILQKDAEGNDYSPLYQVDGEAVYIPDSTYSGIVYSTHWTAEEACQTEEDWAAIKAKPSCVVLAPVN